MRIGCVKEIKKHEYRVGVTPSYVASLTSDGHQVFIESEAGLGSGFTDQEYQLAGATVVSEAASIWNRVEMMIKVKEPLEEEYQYFREDLVLYTYLHLAAETSLTHALAAAKMTAFAYETLSEDGTLPLLKPMSEVAGRLSIQEGAKYLEKTYGGSGILLAGVPGVPRGKVAIIGGGTVGINAAKIALGMGADVTILDSSLSRLESIDHLFQGHVSTLYSNDYEIEKQCSVSDLVIGAVLIPGDKTPKLLKRKYLSKMRRGSVIVDVAVDQGGCFETTHPTYHDNPTYIVDGIVHYCVANMPGATPRTSTIALTNATLKYGLLIARYGVTSRLLNTPLASALNVYKGHITFEAVAHAHNMTYSPLDTLL